jgi:hypothetical protein
MRIGAEVLPAGRTPKPKERTWYPTAENRDFIEALAAGNPDFNQSAFINILVTMARVSSKGSVLDALTITRWRTNDRQDRQD